MCRLQALPDFLVRSDAFDKGMHRIWTAGDRFRMYFGGRAGSKSGRGTSCSLSTLLTATASLHDEFLQATRADQLTDTCVACVDTATSLESPEGAFQVACTIGDRSPKCSGAAGHLYHIA